MAEIFAEKCRIRSGMERRDRVLDKALGAASGNASGLVLGIILLAAIPLYLSGRFSVGEFVMFEYYYVFLASLPDAVGRLIRRKRQADISLERIFRQQDAAMRRTRYGRSIRSAFCWFLLTLLLTFLCSDYRRQRKREEPDSAEAFPGVPGWRFGKLVHLRACPARAV